MDLHQVQIDTWDWQDAPAVAPRQIFAIGDIHGRADLLQALHAEIQRVARPGALLIHLGDYIDKGPWSMQALRLALDGVEGIEVINLPGNHEQYLTVVLDAPLNQQEELMEIWLDNGGRAVARELGCDTSAKDAGARTKLVDAVREALGERRRSQFLSMPNHVYVGGYLFVHGGVNPAVPIAKFLARDWRLHWVDEDLDPLWVRWPFFAHEGLYEGGFVVVHGHTPRDQPELLENRINLDTRACDSGKLTMAEFDGRRFRITQTHGRARKLGSNELE
jgi:serine/threonine protein phosphatase 1